VSCQVLQSGLLTTVQDRGRHGHQRDGVPVSGAMDQIALRVGNLLVGNDDGAAALEVTLTGPTLLFECDAVVALTGGNLAPMVDGSAVPLWRALFLRAGATLTFAGSAGDQERGEGGRRERGCRAYLAIAGGIAVPTVLDSRSTYTPAALGGIAGRALRRGDSVPFGTPSSLAGRIRLALARQSAGHVVARWGAGPSLVPRYSSRPVIRLLPGRHAPLLTPSSLAELWRAEFRIGAQSDRMGFRLEALPLELAEPREVLSEAVAFGTMQLPPGGQAIILLADRQTTGGYPRIGEVATVDHALLGQLKPGDRVRFRAVSLEEAQRLYLAREREIAQARMAIALRHP
jgi:antagonist of KipI